MTRTLKVAVLLLFVATEVGLVGPRVAHADINFVNTFTLNNNFSCNPPQLGATDVFTGQPLDQTGLVSSDIPLTLETHPLGRRVWGLNFLYYYDGTRWNWVWATNQNGAYHWDYWVDGTWYNFDDNFYADSQWQWELPAGTKAYVGWYLIDNDTQAYTYIFDWVPATDAYGNVLYDSNGFYIREYVCDLTPTGSLVTIGGLGDLFVGF
jgi:hypothetical protein